MPLQPRGITYSSWAAIMRLAVGLSESALLFLRYYYVNSSPSYYIFLDSSFDFVLSADSCSCCFLPQHQG